MMVILFISNAPNGANSANSANGVANNSATFTYYKITTTTTTKNKHNTLLPNTGIRVFVHSLSVNLKTWLLPNE